MGAQRTNGVPRVGAHKALSIREVRARRGTAALSERQRGPCGCQLGGGLTRARLAILT
jgi:hypothetical protein